MGTASEKCWQKPGGWLKNGGPVMPNQLEQSPERVINSVYAVPEWGKYTTAVRKIVLGRTPGEGGGGEAAGLELHELPEDLWRDFPEMTHLYLWGIKGLRELPRLPDGLQCLDLRGCADLEMLPALPATLTTLLLDGAKALTGVSDVDLLDLPDLEELSLNECVGLREAWILGLLRVAPKLRRFEAKGCSQITKILVWPRALVDVRLNECAGLTSVPAKWPEKLRRLELRGAAALATLPVFFPASLDYINLEEMRSLRTLPQRQGRPRTLFLFGAGLLMPPASELGERSGENVAERTEAYFADVALAGKGEVKRCKVLLLGNGGAGKTSLALAAATNKDPREADKHGSTHGVQFWPWEGTDFTATVDGLNQAVQVQVWDFGGQAIYHNMHQLFMGKGAVFVVVWKPEQEGQTAPKAGAYQDKWQPLSYWLDYIQLACPHRPHIAIVCSHHAEGTPELKAKLESALAGRAVGAHKCFYINSKYREGQLANLEEWLQEAVGEVVTSQGVCVPAYWEIAQNLAQEWVRKLETEKKSPAWPQQVPRKEFGERLQRAIDEALAKDSEEYALLRNAVAKGEFSLTEDRLTRTLSFLTHSGWVYWKEDLFEGRVILGQKWALDGLYAILERRSGKVIYEALIKSKGRFTLAELAEWGWKQDYNPDEQKLLLSFMERCGLCFQLHRAEEARAGAAVYVSFEHLPTEGKGGPLCAAFERGSAGVEAKEDSWRCDRMHSLHWQKFLVAAGQYYGADAEYAGDALLVENAKGDRIFVQFQPHSKGLGGVVEIRVAGAKPAERWAQVEKQVRQFLPGGEVGPVTPPRDNLGERAERLQIFISYAWDPANGPTGIPAGYAEPVDALQEYFRTQPVEFIRDKHVLGFGDDLLQFMRYGATRSLFIFVHSDRYWRSQYCLFELFTAKEELGHTNRTLRDSVIPIEHRDSEVRNQGGRDALVTYWRNFTPKDASCALDWDTYMIRIHASALILQFAKNLSGLLDVNLKWSDGKDKVFAAIAERLKLPVKAGAGNETAEGD